MGRNRLRFILMKGFLYKMMKKNKKLTIRRLCFIFKASKTLKVKILHKVHSTKKFEKIAEIYNEIVKKNTTAQLHQKSCEKSDGCSIMARSCSLGFFRFGMTRIYVRSLRRKNLKFFLSKTELVKNRIVR